MKLHNGPTPRFHTTTVMPVAGRPTGMRVVLVEGGPLDSQVRFFLDAMEAASPSQERKAAIAIGFLYDFYAAAPPQTGEEQATFFRRFVQALTHGTAKADGTCDPPALYWTPCTNARAREIVREANRFCDYVVAVTGDRPLNPLRPATFSERIAAMQTFEKQKKGSLLAHLKRRSEAERHAAQTKDKGPRALPTADVEPPAFPDMHIDALVWKAFATGGSGRLHERFALRDQMIVILQRFGGLRASEPFHLFVGDVEPEQMDPKRPGLGITARVRLYHPEHGKTVFNDPVTGARVDGTRAEYLSAVWNRHARSSDAMKHQPERAGWKNLLLTDKKRRATEVFWFEPQWGCVFWELYDAYTAYVLPRSLPHPYLFVNLQDRDGVFGAPYKLRSYYERVEAAVASLGLPFNKDAGTTSHGFRHAYAQALEDAGVSEKHQQHCLHQKSPLSRRAYTMPSNAKVRRSLDDAHSRSIAAPPRPHLALPAARIPEE